jgi:hypothetical protein
LRQLSQWFQECGVTHAVVESTGVYWRPVWQILETGGFHLFLANAKRQRNPQTAGVSQPATELLEAVAAVIH